MGDKSLKNCFTTFEDMKTKPNKKREIVIPYLYQYYNVINYTQPSTTRKSVMTNVVNSLIDGLNDRIRLPRFIIVVLDIDLIDKINIWEPEAAMNKNFNDVFTWIAWQFSINIKCRKLEITEKSPGAIFGDDPKVIYVKMLRRYEYYPRSSLLGKYVQPEQNLMTALTQRQQNMSTK